MPRRSKELAEIESMFDFPHSTSPGVIGLLRNKVPVLCASFNPQLLCSYHESKQGWTIFENQPVLEESWWTSGIVVGRENETLFYVEGESGGYSNATHFVTLSDGSPPEMTAESGPLLPLPRTHSCFTKINDSHAIIAGGRYRDPLYHQATLFFNIQDRVWSEGPSINQARSTRYCVLLQDLSSSHGEYLVMADGYHGIDDYSTELLILAENRWIEEPPEAPRLLYTIDSNSLTPTPDRKGAILLGGETIIPENGRDIPVKTMALLSCFRRECRWTLLKSELQVARGHPYVLLIPRALGK